MYVGYVLYRLPHETKEVSCAFSFVASHKIRKSLSALFYPWSSLTIVPSDLLNFTQIHFKHKETLGQSVK